MNQVDITSTFNNIGPSALLPSHILILTEKFVADLEVVCAEISQPFLFCG